MFGGERWACSHTYFHTKFVDPSATIRHVIRRLQQGFHFAHCDIPPQPLVDRHSGDRAEASALCPRRLRATPEQGEVRTIDRIGWSTKSHPDRPPFGHKGDPGDLFNFVSQSHRVVQIPLVAHGRAIGGFTSCPSPLAHDIAALSSTGASTTAPTSTT